MSLPRLSYFCFPLLLIGSADADVHVLRASLSGGASTGTGSAEVVVDDVTGLVTVTGDYTGLQASLGASHLHAPTTILLPLMNTHGTDGTFSGAGILDSAQIAIILGGASFVNLHTAFEPLGELSGTARYPLVDIDVGLTGAAHVPPVPGSGAGTANVRVDRATGTVAVFGAYQGLSSPATAVELRGPAPHDSTGPLLLSVTQTGGTQGSFQGTGPLSPSLLRAVLDGLAYVELTTTQHPTGELRGQVERDTLGERYCPALANSSGLPAELRAHGSVLASRDELLLGVTSAPAAVTAYPLATRGTGQQFPVFAAAGRLCVVGPGRVRLTGSLAVTDGAGIASLPVPLGTLLGGAQPGDTWCFQAWFRDPQAGTSNFSEALALQFR